MVKGILIISNLIVAILMAITLIGSVISPEKFILPAYTSLFFPLTILVNAAFVVFWIVARKWYFIISLAILFTGSKEISDVFAFNFGEVESEYTSKPVHILTYNTHLLAGMVKHTKKQPNGVIQYILDSNADIVCLQEFAVSPKKEYITDDDIDKIFRKDYPYRFVYYHNDKKWANVGIAIMSKFPILKKKIIDIGSNYNISVFADIVIEKDTVRLINNHLESNKLTETDREMPIQLKDSFNTERFSGTTMHLSRKLESAYKIRARQADKIAGIIKDSPYKVIVCGDFNDVPASYTYTKVRGELKDAFTEQGFGFGWTLNIPAYKFRIDYIMYDRSFMAADYRVGKCKSSDHYPVECNLYLEK